MPSLSLPKQTQIVRRLEKMGLEVQALPSFAQLIGEEALIDKLSPILPGQLLGRAQLDQQIRTAGRAFHRAHGADLGRGRLHRVGAVPSGAGLQTRTHGAV